MRSIGLLLLLLIASLTPELALAAEDPCIGESADAPVAVCTDVEISEWRVSASWSLDRADYSDDIWECRGRGGTWGRDLSGSLACLDPADWTEENFISMAQAIASQPYNLTGVIVDSGWEQHPGNFLCDGNVSGIPTRECRSLVLPFQYEGGALSQTSFLGIRHREVRCPNGYLSISTPAGTRCKMIICDSTCQDANGTKHPSLANVRREPIFSKPGSLLSFERIWTLQAVTCSPRSEPRSVAMTRRATRPPSAGTGTSPTTIVVEW